MTAIAGALVFAAGLAVVNWLLGALFRWIPELVRRPRPGGGRGGGLRRHRPHPGPSGHPTGRVGPVGPVDEDRRPVSVG